MTRPLARSGARRRRRGLPSPSLLAGVAQQEPVKIGVIQPLSGPVAASGNYVRMGAEIGRDWINAQGGVLGRPVQLLIEDNKSDPKEAATAAEKLIVRDKVPVIVGAWGSSMTLAAMPKLEEYGVPMVVETSSAASITKRGNPWVFRISPPSEMEALGLERYLRDLGIKKADFLAVNTDWGRGAVTAFGDVLKRAGAAVGARRVHGPGRHRHERPDHQDQGRAAATRCSSPPASSRSCSSSSRPRSSAWPAR